MSAHPSQIIAALDVIEKRITPHSLIKSGAVTREAEAKHLLEMVREAKNFIEEKNGYAVSR